MAPLLAKDGRVTGWVDGLQGWVGRFERNVQKRIALYGFDMVFRLPSIPPRNRKARVEHFKAFPRSGLLLKYEVESTQIKVSIFTVFGTNDWLLNYTSCVIV